MVPVSVSGAPVVSAARVGWWCPCRLVVPLWLVLPVSVGGARVGEWCPYGLVVPVSISGARVG